MNQALANARFKALLGAALLAAITSPWAKNLRVAVQGDGLSMDPHSLAQAVPFSFTGNVCEPLDPRKGARGHWNLGAYSNIKLDALMQETLALHRDDIGRVLRMLADRCEMAIVLVEQYCDFVGRAGRSLR